MPRRNEIRLEFCNGGGGAQNTRMMLQPECRKRDDVSFRFDTVSLPALDRQTDERTDRQTDGQTDG